MTTIPTAWLMNATDLLLGVSDIDEQNKLWLEFLNSEGAYSHLDQTTKTIPFLAALSPAVQSAYLQFLRGKLSVAEQSENINALSPKEIESRYSLLQAFTIVLAMLKALQNAMKEQSELLNFYAVWQRNYTKMMTQTPVYGPMGNLGIIVNKTDVGQTTLGYANISINEIVDYLYSRLDSSNTTATFSTPSDPYENVSWKFTLVQNPDNTYTLNVGIDNQTIRVDKDDTSEDIPVNAPLFTNISSGVIDSTLSAEEKRQAVLRGISSGLTASLQTNLTTNPTGIAIPWTPPADKDDSQTYHGGANVTWEEFANWDGSQNPTILSLGIIGPALGPSTPGDDVKFGAGAWDEQLGGAYKESSSSDKTTAQNKRQASQAYRGDVNAQLSQYIQNTQSNRTRVSNLSDQTQSLMDQTKDAITAQKDLLQSMADTMSSLISAIFR